MLVKLNHTTSDEIVRPCRSLMNVQGRKEGRRGVGQPSPSLVIKGKKEREGGKRKEKKARTENENNKKGGVRGERSAS